MNKRGTISLGILAVSVIAGFWGINHLCQRLLQARSVSFAFDTVLSKVQQEKIKFTVCQTGFKNPASVATLIKEKFPIIDQVIVQRHPNARWHIMVTSTPPLVRVNQQWILTELGAFVPCAHYHEPCLMGIPDIYMKTSARSTPLVSGTFKAWLIALNKTVFERYSLTWNHDYEIILTEKNNPSFSIVTTCLQPLSEQALALCENIKKDIAQHKTQSNAKIVKADIRFDKQIVVSGDNGGNKHG